MHLNSNTFVTGETLYYKLYCINPNNNKPSEISKVAYVEIIDKNKNNVFKQKIFLDYANGQGDFFIVPSLNTGNYKIIAYTNWILNKPHSGMYQTDITIINPFQEIEQNKVITNHSDTEKSTQITETNSKTSENSILDLNKKSFSKRELVSLQLKKTSNLEKGNYSISVRKKEELSNRIPSNAISFNIKKSYNELNKATDVFLPELRGEIISGTINSKQSSDEIKNIDITLSIPGKPFVMKIVKTNKEGKFSFNLEKPYYNSNVIIEVLDDRKENYIITLDKQQNVDYSFLDFSSDLKLEPELREKIQERSIASQIENAYFTKKSDSLARTIKPSPFYDPNAKDYILDDYTRFPTLKETFVEITKEIYTKENDNKISLYVNDYDPTHELAEPALVMVDGLLIQNINELMEYKTKHVYKISVVIGGYYYGSAAFNGIISIITKNNDYESKSFGDYIIKPEILRPSKNKIYYKPDYSDLTKNNRIPDFRNQLLWSPEVNINDKINFYTSDVTGIFEITLEGFSENGIPVSETETFEVVK